MKDLIYPLTIFATMFIACKKQGCMQFSNKPANQAAKVTMLNLNPSNDPTQISKWKCIGGDTLFQDTLKLTLQSVWYDKKVKTEVHKFSFSYPVWSHCEWVATNYDAAVISQLSFSNEDCKTVYYQKIGN